MKFRIVISICSLLVIAALGFSIQSFAQDERADAKGAHQGTLTEFDVPDASPSPGLGTQAFANNDLGEVVGVYTDANVVPHGFIRAADGKITSFDAPGAGLGAGLEQGTVAYSVNDFGVIAGQFEDPSDVFHGFVRQPDGKITAFSAPGAGTSAGQGGGSASITALGAITGYFFDSDNLPNGFVRTPDGKFTTFNVAGSSGTAAFSINLLDTVTGVYADANFAFHGYSRSASALTPSSMLPTPAPARSRAPATRPTTWKARSPAGLPLQPAEIVASYGNRKRAAMLTGCE